MKLIKIITGFLIIAFIQYISVLLVKFSGVVFPPPLVGMILLALLLGFRVIPMTLMKDACSVLLNHMVLFFVPITIGVVLYRDVLFKNILVLGVVIFVSTILTLLMSALVGDYFVEKKKRELERD